MGAPKFQFMNTWNQLINGLHKVLLRFVWDFYIISSPLCIMCHKSKTRGVRDDVVYCDICFAKNKAMCLSKICAYFLVFVAENNL